MHVIPVINCADKPCVEARLAAIAAFYPKEGLVHLDVTDGVFAVHHAWGDPWGWRGLHAPFGLEVHLMVERPEERADDWLSAGARRLVVHAETVTRRSLEEIRSVAERHHAEVALSSNPDSGTDLMEPYLDLFSVFHVLAVHPGPSAQAFMPSVCEKIAFLREAVPGATIEVDGGMNPETARRVKIAGADTVLSSSYLFGARDPKQAYGEFMKI